MSNSGVSFTFPTRPLLILVALVVLGAAIWMFLPGKRSVAGATVQQAAAGTTTGSWKPVSARLMTKYSASVSPSAVRTEYPRPQFARKDWLSLNGIWEFAFDDVNEGSAGGWKSGKEFAERILVPFTYEAALSGIGRGEEVHERVWYRRSFEVPSGWKGKRVLLNFGAVDWEAEVFLNGRSVVQHKGGYTPFSVDITDALVDSKPQELVVRVFDPSEKSGVGWQPRGKQKGSEGIWYTRTTGIWQSVWLEPVPEAHLSSMKIAGSLSPNGAGVLKLAGTLPTPANGLTLEVELSEQGGGKVATQSAKVAGGKAALTLTVPNAKAWTPETPRLYDVNIKLLSGSTPVDTVSSYTAFRNVGIAKGRLTLNGKPYFYRGVLDQGYWPDGILTAPSDEALRADVEATKKFGFNMARKHIKLEDPRWYYWCDKLGVAVWQDMPSVTTLVAKEARDNFTREWRDIMGVAENYPCVVHWIPFNEDWGHPEAFQDEIVHLTRKWDPTRPITDASGWTQRSFTDVIDSHNYSDDLIREGVENPVKPKVVGEYGGVGMSVPGHVWAEGRIYVHAQDRKQLLDLLRRRTSQLFVAPGMSGYVYTQLSDVEQELNGLLTYDRIPKTDEALVAKIMNGQDIAPEIRAKPISDWLVLGPVPSGIEVPGTQPTPEALEGMGRILDKAYVSNEGSLKPEAGDTVEVQGAKPLRWKRITGPSQDFQTTLGGGPHSNAVAYAVAYVDSPRDVSNATLYLGSDDGVVVWLNGKQVHRKIAIRGVQAFEDSVSGLTLRKGRNTLVAKVGQGGGGWGLSARVLTP